MIKLLLPKTTVYRWFSYNNTCIGGYDYDVSPTEVSKYMDYDLSFANYCDRVIRYLDYYDSKS